MSVGPPSHMIERTPYSSRSRASSGRRSNGPASERRYSTWAATPLSSAPAWVRITTRELRVLEQRHVRGTLRPPLTISASGSGASPSRSRLARSSSLFTIGP